MTQRPSAEPRDREIVLRFRVPNFGFGPFDPWAWAPANVGAHVRNAQRESLLAIRSVIDALIDRIEREERKQSNASGRVEVSYGVVVCGTATTTPRRAYRRSESAAASPLG
ncbi:MAG: hypothetical protein NZ518_06395 [Dehalococcoidia bacterium]|nr:hypothetical protein [Dehalococcoidia bacterium]